MSVPENVYNCIIMDVEVINLYMCRDTKQTWIQHKFMISAYLTVTYY